MKTLKLITIIFALIITSSCNKTKENEWKSLFNGKNLDNWVVKVHKYELGDNYANTFRVKNGIIQVNYDGYEKFEERFAHLFYNKSFSSFHLKFEYRFTDQWLKDAPIFTFRNSGIMFHSQAPETILKNQNWPISVEYQLLADEGKGERQTANMCSPGTEVIFNNEIDPRHCIRSNSKTYKWDDWVSGEIIVYKDSLITHIVNGNKVLQYTKPHIGGSVVKGFDPAIKIDGKPLTEGYIGLQSEGQGVEFRELKIKEL